MFVQRCNEYELQKLYETAQEASEIIKKTKLVELKALYIFFN
mgnify:CR=1 FL=1